MRVNGFDGFLMVLAAGFVPLAAMVLASSTAMPSVSGASPTDSPIPGPQTGMVDAPSLPSPGSTLQDDGAPPPTVELNVDSASADAFGCPLAAEPPGATDAVCVLEGQGADAVLDQPGPADPAPLPTNPNLDAGEDVTHQSESVLPSELKVRTVVGLFWGLSGALLVVLGTHLASQRGTRRDAPSPTQPQAPSAPPLASAAASLQDVDALEDRLRADPFDAEAAFRFSLQLLREGRADEGMRFMDRAFRLQPLLVVPFLQEEEYADVRGVERVRTLLQGMRRDSERRSFAGYA